MLGSIKVKFTAVFLIVLVITIFIFSTAIYGLVNSEMYNPGPKMQVGWMMKTHPDRFRGIDRIDKDLYEEIKAYIEEEERERFQRLVFTLMVPTILISGALAYITAYYLVKPIQKLAEDIEELGDEDFSRRLPSTDAPEEIEYLRASFNKQLSKVESAFNSQEEFIQDAAHELRTPLASMKARLSLVKKKDKTTIQEYGDAIDVLSRMNDKLVKLSEDLLYLDRRKTPKLHDLNLSELIDDVVESISPQAKERNVEIQKVYKFQGKILADPIALARAFENIIENAIKYGASKLIIKTKLVGDQISIEVEDDGEGMKSSDLENVFERFYRGDSEKQVDGSGLGLSIVKKIIEDHEGSIELLSKKGEGTIVSILLPREK